MRARILARIQTRPIHHQGPVWFCSVLVNSDILTAYYGVKQSQFAKPTSDPRVSDPEESNEAFDRATRGWLL